MFELYTIIINLIISVSILNVWLIRFNKATTYRGGDANSMKEEFAAYGLRLIGLCTLLVRLKCCCL